MHALHRTALIVIFVSVLGFLSFEAYAGESKGDIWTLSIENDLFGGGTDENYTNGIRLSYREGVNAVPDWVREASILIPTFSVNNSTTIHYSVGQNLYTPENIKDPNPAPDTRPYAAWLYGSVGLTSVTGNHKDDAEIAIGMVGPAALGKQVHRNFHALINADDPKGWDHQLKNEPGLILSWQRSWPSALTYSFDDSLLDFEPHVGVSAGNIYTYAATGASLKLFPFSQPVQSNPVRIRPAIPGDGYFETPKDGWGWYLFSGIEGRMIGRNIFLDGNSFTDSRSVDKKPFVADINAGVAMTYHKYRVSYTLNYRTREYDGQDSPQIFGSISLSRRF